MRRAALLYMPIELLAIVQAVRYYHRNPKG